MTYSFSDLEKQWQNLDAPTRQAIAQILGKSEPEINDIMRGCRMIVSVATAKAPGLRPQTEQAQH